MITVINMNDTNLLNELLSRMPVGDGETKGDPMDYIVNGLLSLVHQQ